MIGIEMGIEIVKGSGMMQGRLKYESQQGIE